MPNLELWVDGVSRGAVASPVAWDSREYGNGPHYLVVRAVDGTGNVGTGVVRLVVAN